MSDVVQKPKKYSLAEMVGGISRAYFDLEGEQQFLITVGLRPFPDAGVMERIAQMRAACELLELLDGFGDDFRRYVKAQLARRSPGDAA